MRRAIERMQQGIHCSHEEMTALAYQLFDEQTDEELIRECLITLYHKGEVAEEMAAVAKVMRALARPIESDTLYFDNCGTGGDGAQTFNISTTSAFVLAAAGLPVLKHGNRKISSESGSSDVLEALNIPFQLAVNEHVSRVEQIGLSFLHAPDVHPALGRIGRIRASIPHATIFNLVGPLANPAPLQAQLIGVGRPELLAEYAKAMQLIGLQGMVVTNDLGLDEASCDGQNHCIFVTQQALVPYTFRAQEVGLPVHSLASIRGGNHLVNAAVTTRVLNGEEGPHLDTVLLNAGLALLAAGRVATIEAGIERAREVVQSGKAAQLLQAAKQPVEVSI